VIAGYGIAGAAAVEAASAGADVLVVERTGGWVGAAMAGGFIYMGGGTPLQKACGFDDSVDNNVGGEPIPDLCTPDVQRRRA
jgi:3-oxo-5alpha-steroid 4-dehydrogenase